MSKLDLNVAKVSVQQYKKNPKSLKVEKKMHDLQIYIK